MASFFDEVSRNRTRSILLMVLFTVFFAIIVVIFSYVFELGLLGVIIGIALVLIYAAVVYFTGDKLVLKMSGAQPADPQQYKDYDSIVDGLASATQVPKPKIYVINDPNPNAFATGKNQKASSVAATTGLLNMMNKEELEGVLAHEMSHVANNDIQFMMIAIVFVGVIGIISAIIRNAIFFGFGGNNRNGGVIIIIALVIGVLAPIFALLVELAISRRREYMADANGARLIRDPAALASALQKIQDYTKTPAAKPIKNANEVNAPLYFASPFTAKSVFNLLSTHPPIEERIKRLKAMY